MQLIAREINFSETTFVFPSKEKGVDANVRIFTPAEEMPFAGHPTIGTAYVLMKNAKGKKPSKLVLGLEAGKIEVDVVKSNKSETRLRMTQPVPQFGSALQNRGQAARAGDRHVGDRACRSGWSRVPIPRREAERPRFLG